MPAGKMYKSSGRGRQTGRRRVKFGKIYRYRKKYTKPTHAVIKSHKSVGYDNVSLFGTSGAGLGGDPQEWILIKPLNLNRVTNAAPDDNDRQANTINARNVSTKIELFPSKRYKQPFQMRIAYGYFKGTNSGGSQTLNAEALKSLYPDVNDALWDREAAGKQDFKWKYHRTYTMTPRNIYDEDTEEGDHVGADRTLVANWMPRKFGINFKFNRRFTYENEDGDSLDGWMPIVAIQCKPIPGGSQFTRPALPTSADIGAFPSPRLSINTTMYFNDVH